jgi:regulatory protein
MRSDPRKVSSDADLYAAALRALMRRAHSTFELRTYLERRAVESEAVRRVLSRLKQEKLLDDSRYALEFARVHATSRRQGAHRIVQELRKRGVPDRSIDDAIAQVFADIDEAAIVRKVIERRTRSARGRLDANPLDARKTASLYRALYGALLRAGFDGSIIRRELNTIARNSEREVPESALADDAPDETQDETQDKR